MAKRPPLDVTSPEFGRWLKSRRGKKSLEQIAQKLRPLVTESGQKVNRTSLHQFENGRIPNWPILAAFAVVYKEPYDKLVIRLARSLEFPGSRDLISQSKVVDSPNTNIRGVPNANAAADLRELQDQIETYRALFVSAHRLSIELAELTAGVIQTG